MVLNSFSFYKSIVFLSSKKCNKQWSFACVFLSKKRKKKFFFFCDVDGDSKQCLQFFEKCVIAFATWCSSPTKNSILSFRFSQFSFFLFSHFVLINVVENPKIGKINDLVKKPLLSEVSDVEKLFVVIFWPNIEIDRKKKGKKKNSFPN